ncbi:hypothetical protein [Ligilactobacillus apodemi]|uniref:hypothetical protein n=1 Tax=Ligilactobacillus apodemi TaxID=307126 RepID=UPI00214BF942|nr:hypothetical protein [Ligilactobacillus apodemi]
MNYKKIKITQKLERLTDQELLLAIWQVFLTLPQATKEILRDKQISEFKNYTVTDWENFTAERFLCQGLRMLCEFAKRYDKCPDLPLGVVCSSKVIGEYMIEKLSGVKQEMLIGVYLDTKNQLLAEKRSLSGLWIQQQCIRVKFSSTLLVTVLPDLLSCIIILVDKLVLRQMI